jgi:hypothetical protein
MNSNRVSGAVSDACDRFTRIEPVSQLSRSGHASPLEIPEPVVDFDLGQVRNAEAGDDMDHLGAMRLVVEDHHEDRPTVRLGGAGVVAEGVIQAPFIPHPSREHREGRVGALVVRDQRVQRTGASLGLDRLPGHQAHPEVKVGNLVIERLPQRPVPDVERLIELRVGEAAAQFQHVGGGPTVVLQQPVKQIYLISSMTRRPPQALGMQPS